jgi:hypothetical protein
MRSTAPTPARTCWAALGLTTAGANDAASADPKPTSAVSAASACFLKYSNLPPVAVAADNSHWSRSGADRPGRAEVDWQTKSADDGLRLWPRVTPAARWTR